MPKPLQPEIRERFHNHFHDNCWKDGEYDKEAVLMFFEPIIAEAEERGVKEARSEYRGHLMFLYRWISRLNGDKPHDRPETDWKTYVEVMVQYPLSPWQTGDWFEDDLEDSQ